MDALGREPAVTDLLARWREGDAEAGEAVAPLVYDEMRKIARRLFRGERREHTLQATALVHEVFIELIERRGIEWPNRAQFYGFTAHMMRRVLVHHSRQRGAAKRGAQWTKVAFDELRDLPLDRAADLVALDDALSVLQAHDPLQAKLVELRVFGGLTIAESAQFLGCSPSTANRAWTQALAHLGRILTGDAVGA